MNLPKIPIIPIIIAIVIVAAVGGLYFSGFELEAGTQTSEDAERNTITGLQIAEQSLDLIDESLVSSSGEYVEYLSYGNFVETVEGVDEVESDNEIVQQFLNGRLYLVYDELADVTGSNEYRDKASSKFSIFYNACGEVCVDGYDIVYNEWKRTGDSKYSEMLDRMTSEDEILHMEEAVGIDDAEILHASNYFIISSTPDDCYSADAILSTEPDVDYVIFEDFAERISSVLNEEPSQYMSSLVSCGNMMAQLSDLSGDDKFRDMSIEVLQIIYDRHPDFKEVEFGNENNLHITDDVVSVALLGARLADAEIEVSSN